MKKEKNITYIYQVYDICMWGYIYIIYILYIILYTALFGFLSVCAKPNHTYPMRDLCTPY